MDSVLGHLKPKRLWDIFEEICQIPRPSGNEERILEYLKRFAERHQLEYEQDGAGNLVIRKNASKGYEDRPVVVLQGHVDMVCEKNADVSHDFDKDPIMPVIDDGWVKARGTTLGADNGIGVAAQLAILESSAIEHGPLECLFTVEEETGLAGAFGLKPGFIKGRIMLNLDSEQDGELCIGCAGGIDTTARLPYQRVNTEVDHLPYHIQVSGLLGGHSGDDIHKGRGNAIKMLVRMLWNAGNAYELRLAEIKGGNLRNAIAREAFASFTIPRRHAENFKKGFDDTVAALKGEWKTTEPGMQISLREVVMPQCLIDFNTQLRLINALYACPHGVIRMSADIPGLVETSTNLASVAVTPSDIVLATSQRSSVHSAKKDIADMVASVFLLAGADVKHGEGYPGWKPDTDSHILKVMKETYRGLYGEHPSVIATHAGLECGIIGEKYPGMDMISYGPTMRDAHSPDERVHIDAVEKFWNLTLETLRRLGD